MPKDTISKAIDAMGVRVTEIMKADPTLRSRESAISKIAASGDPRDQRLWLDYKNDSFVNEVAVEPEPVTKSRAYTTLEAKAAEIGKRFPQLSPEQCFARAYEQNRDLAEQDKIHHYSKLAGGDGGDMPAARTSHQTINDERQAHIDKSHGANVALIDKAATADRLFQDLCRALAAMYPQFGPDRIRTLARSVQAHAPDLPRLGRDRGYRGSADRTTVA